MILLEDILKVHQFSIDRYGGGTGVRDLGGVASAFARPFQTFGGNDNNVHASLASAPSFC